MRDPPRRSPRIDPGVEIRVNLLRDTHRGLKTHIEIESNLRQERQVGTQPGRNEHACSRIESPPVFCDQGPPAVLVQNLFGAEPGDQVDKPIVDGLLRALPERSAPATHQLCPAEGVADQAAT